MDSERLRQIEELYHAVREQSPSQRLLLAQADGEVRKYVESLLAQDQVEGLMDHRAADLLADSAATQPIAGKRLGPYQLEALLGEGGMGQVFRALDTRLDRKVALKICPERFSGWFEREARAIAALNHPHICTLYDVGPNYLVMELVEGVTLASRLKDGALSVQTVLDYGAQIADGLAAAHERGIIHRDLKPGNIMVTAGGRVKLLDFGIAKRMDGELSTLSTQVIDPVTLPGAILGTPGYMSPEQARGEKLDFRSDQFAFGVVLYEMATGRRAFQGKSAAELYAAVLLQQPESVTRLNPTAPAPLQWLVERCLAKSAADRFPSTIEIKRELLAIAATAVVRTSPASIENLPAQRTTLIGREDELGRLRELTLDPDIRLLTLTGAGGIGKTRLLIELGRQMAESFSGGVYYVPLDKVSQSALVPSEVARALGVNPIAEISLETAIFRFLRQNLIGPTLLLLDNFEHVLDAAPFVARLPSERLKVVVTSRAALRVYGEYEFAVPSTVFRTRQRAVSRPRCIIPGTSARPARLRERGAAADRGGDLYPAGRAATGDRAGRGPHQAVSAQDAAGSSGRSSGSAGGRSPRFAATSAHAARDARLELQPA